MDCNDANHVYEIELGAGGRPRVSLRVFRPRAGVPATRGDCPTERPCPHIRCEWNLWMVDGRDRPGRRWDGGKAPASVVVVHEAQNCGADIADAVGRGEMSAADVAKYIPGAADADDVSTASLSDRQLRRIAEKARRKMAAEKAAADVLEDMAQTDHPVDSVMSGKPRK